jgi:4-carboxymuconolactone decarboxylase
MTRLTRRSTADLTEAQRELFARMAEGRTGVTDGHIGGPFDAWLLSPATGLRLFQLGGALRHKPCIDRRYVELAILVTGQLWQAQYEWYAHEPMARAAGLPDEVIAAVKEGREPAFTDAGDEAAWRFSRMLHDRRRVDDATYAATVAVFGEDGVQELINACGLYTLVSMTLNVFDVDLPAGATKPFPD